MTGRWWEPGAAVGVAIGMIALGFAFECLSMRWRRGH